MTLQRFENGPRMSRVVVHNDTVYLAGLTADATAGQSVGEQTKEILAKIDGLLKQGGTDKSKLAAGDDLAPGHPHRRRVQQGMGRLGGGGLGAGARLHRGAAAIAEEDDRNSGDGGAVKHGLARIEHRSMPATAAVPRVSAHGLALHCAPRSVRKRPPGALDGRARLDGVMPALQIGISQADVLDAVRCTSGYMVMSAIE